MEAFPNRGCFESSGRGYFAVVGRQKSLFSGVVIGPKSLFCFTLIACNFEICAAHRHAQRYTSLLVPCAHGKPNVKHYRSTPKPETHTRITRQVVDNEAALCGEKIENRAPKKRIQAAQPPLPATRQSSNTIIEWNLYPYVG